MLFILFILLFLSPQSLAVEPEFRIAHPWTSEEVSEGKWALYFGNQRQTFITLNRNPTDWGIALTHENREMKVQRAEKSLNLFQPSFSMDQTQRLIVETQGIDLIIRFDGPPIRDWLNDDTAPVDPVLSWSRIRFRGQGVRFVFIGLFQWTLPASDEGPRPVPEKNGGVQFSHGFGTWRFETTASTISGNTDHAIWTMDTAPTLQQKQPYSESTIDWNP